MVRQVAQPSTRPYASRQIDTAAAWMKHLRGHGILKGKVLRGLPRVQYEDAVESIRGIHLVYATETVDRLAGVPFA